MAHQPGIIASVPKSCRYMKFNLKGMGDARAALQRLVQRELGEHTVLGIGQPLVKALQASVPGLGAFPQMVGPKHSVPSTQAALWCWLRGEDRGELLHAGRSIARDLENSFRIDATVDGFRHDTGRDLTGYEDGTENPEGDAALEAAFARGEPGVAGSSYVAVQRWLHDLDEFEGLSQDERDTIIGRRRSDNEEIQDAPPSAHVKRTEQESFDPKAFVLRRSMPWADSTGEGLMFVAFGKSFDAFEAQLHRMLGQDDGIGDALFRFSRPVTGDYFWCPPVRDGKLDLTILGL